MLLNELKQKDQDIFVDHAYLVTTRLSESKSARMYHPYTLPISSFCLGRGKNSFGGGLRGGENNLFVSSSKRSVSKVEFRQKTVLDTAPLGGRHRKKFVCCDKIEGLSVEISFKVQPEMGVGLIEDKLILRVFL